MSQGKAIEKEEMLQAILIADSYNDNLQPLTSTTPLALLPLANVPLIEYALETLSRNGVEEVFVFCSNHIADVRLYIYMRQDTCSTWSSEMEVTVVSSQSCSSVGEAIRDLDARNMLRGNVLLLGVDSVTNADLAALVDEHKRLLKIDRGAVMTVVYKEGLQRMRTGSEVMIAMEATTRRLLYHQRLMLQGKERNFEIPLEVFLAHRNVVVCHGLIDPQIAVCSRAALPLFADNFDYLSRDDFVRGVLNNEDILNCRIYVAKLAKEEYAMRVSNWQSYHLVSLDVINRWLYPLVPDMAIGDYWRQYKHVRNNVYLHREVRLNKSCELVGDLVVGKKSEICEGAYLRQSVVGNFCWIGRDCRVVNSFLMDGAILVDGAVVSHCVVGRNVMVGFECIINSGTVLGDRVEIPERMIVPGPLLLQANEPPAGERRNTVQKIADRAYIFPRKDEDYTDSDEEGNQLGHQALNQPLPIAPLLNRYPSSVFEPSDDEDDSKLTSPVADDENMFLSEVMESLERGLSDRTEAQYLILEINSSRYAYNMALRDVNYCVVKAILQIMLQQDGVATNTVATLRQLLDYFGAIFRNYIRDRSAMMDCLKAFEDMSLANGTLRTALAPLVHDLYEEDMIEEEVIIEWYEGLEDIAIKTTLSTLVQWLQESSEEDGEEDDKD